MKIVIETGDKTGAAGHTMYIIGKGDEIMSEHDIHDCGCDHVNKGISCDVKNCHYHQGDCYCTADKITVGPSFASSSTDTICATFKPEKN